MTLPPVNTQRLQQLDIAHVWHPFTQMAAYADEQAPVIIAGDQFHLIDTAGRTYLDGTSSLWCNIHGHRVPEIDAAIRSQLDQVAHSTLLGLGNVPSIELAAALVRRAPAGLNHVFFSDDGSTAVEAALKIVYQYHNQREPISPEQHPGEQHPGEQQPPVGNAATASTASTSRRDTFVRLSAAYHGDTLGAVSVGGIEQFHATYKPLLFPSLEVPSPCPSLRATNQSAADYIAQAYRILEETLRTHAARIAGFIIEPLVQAAAGLLMHPTGYLQRVRELTAELGIPLIADEVAVGFGRTGTLFACEHEAVCPDVLCLSKGLTAGYLPLAATLVTTPIYNAFLGPIGSGRTFFHGHTFTGNPLGCAAAIASLQLFETRQTLDNVRQNAAFLTEQLAAWKDHPNVADVRQSGVIAGIHLVKDRSGPTPFAVTSRAGHRVTLAARNRGVIIRPLGDVVVLMPAPGMPLRDLKTLCDITFASINEVLANRSIV